MSSLGRLEAVEITELFGDPDRSFTIDCDGSAPTVLTGSNGTGKSTILRLIKAVSEADVRLLNGAPIAGLRLKFADSPDFAVSRDPNGRTMTLRHGDDSWDCEADTGILDDLPEWAVSALEDAPADEDEDYYDDVLMQVARSSEVDFKEFRAVRTRVREAGSPISIPEAPGWVTAFAAAFPVLFLTDQRLVIEPDSRSDRHRPGGRQRSQRAVELASRDLASRMRSVDGDYARESRNQDQSFPGSVIAAMKSDHVIAKSELNVLQDQVLDRREALLDVGLLESDEVGLEVVEDELADPQVRPVIETFFRSTLAKLAVFDELEERLREFKLFIDQRFSRKTVSLSASSGVLFNTHTGAQIRPKDLSSGEQQMFVLAYEILFRAKPGTLVVVDEPEISLHMLWQDTLIENLAGMARANDLQFLLATHSLALVASHPELERSLDR